MRTGAEGVRPSEEERKDEETKDDEEEPDCSERLEAAMARECYGASCRPARGELPCSCHTSPTGISGQCVLCREEHTCAPMGHFVSLRTSMECLTSMGKGSPRRHAPMCPPGRMSDLSYYCGSCFCPEAERQLNRRSIELSRETDRLFWRYVRGLVTAVEVQEKCVSRVEE